WRSPPSAFAAAHGHAARRRYPRGPFRRHAACRRSGLSRRRAPVLRVSVLLRTRAAPTDALLHVVEHGLGVAALGREQRQSPDQERNLRNYWQRETDHTENQQQAPERDISGPPEMLSHRGPTTRTIVAAGERDRQLEQELGE